MIRAMPRESSPLRQMERFSFFVGLQLLLAACSALDVPTADREEGMLVLASRSRDPNGRPSERTLRWEARKTAVIIVDMWDDHWCKGAARRVGELAGPVNDAVRELRGRGVLAIHAPSTTVKPYEGTPSRERARRAPFRATPAPLPTSERWGTAWCWPDPKRERVLPIDDSDMGCDCEKKCPIEPPWKRQIAAIEIRDEDAVSDDGQEVFNLLSERGIENVIVLGVHLNMCVLGRPFAIRQQVALGKNVVLVRDLTDTMYNSQRPPGVDHFTGTDLVVEHVERYWCPSILSSDLTGRAPFRFDEDRRPKRGID